MNEVTEKSEVLLTALMSDVKEKPMDTDDRLVELLVRRNVVKQELHDADQALSNLEGKLSKLRLRFNDATKELSNVNLAIKRYYTIPTPQSLMGNPELYATWVKRNKDGVFKVMREYFESL